MTTMAQTMHDNEGRRYRARIGETAWQMLKEIESEYGNEAARKAARMLDAYLEQNVIPRA